MDRSDAGGADAINAIDENGNVANIKPVSGHELLIPAAIDAVRHWQYRPFVSNGQVVKVQTPITVIFLLNSRR